METLSTLHLLRPWWLLALPVWLLLSYGLWRSQGKDSGWSALCDPALLAYLGGDKQRRKRSAWLSAALLIGGGLAITALAGPVWKALPQPVYRAQSAMVIVLDLSRSMDAGDLKPSRLVRAKQKVRDILQARTEGQTGLVVFAGSAFDVVPLTTDDKAILALLPSLDTSIMPVQGSQASAGLKHAEAMLKRGAIRHGSIVMLTDGVDADAVNVAKQLAAAGDRLSILGAGTPAGAPIPLANGGFLRDKQSNIVIARLHEGRLKVLAKEGDGIYQRMRADDKDVQRLPGLHPAHARSEIKSQMQTDQWREEGPWLVLLILPLLTLVFRRGVLLMLILAPLAMPHQADASAWRDLWQTPDQQGQALMQQGNAEAAAKHFHNPAWKGSALYKTGRFASAAKTLANVNTADGLYNRGNALARAGKLQKAIAAYDQALKLEPTQADAIFNRKLVEKLLQQQHQQKNKKQGRKQGKEGRTQPRDQGKQSGGQSGQASGPGKKRPSNKQSQSAQQRADQSVDQNGKQNGNQADKAQRPGQQAKGDQKPAEKPQSASAVQKAGAAEKGDRQQSVRGVAATSEKNMEKENARRQWLRRIPDDPGGLLRRKFLYQYQQQGDHSTGGQAW